MKIEYSRIERKTEDHTLGQMQIMRKDGWQVDSIDGEEPLDFCEVCGGPIMEGQPMQGDREGTVWHVQCPAAD